MFMGCCAPYYPCVMACNRRKNSCFYGDNYHVGTFKQPAEELLDRDDPNLLHVCFMQTEPLFGGIPLCFEDDYPHTNEPLTELIPPDNYNMTIMNINFRIDRNIPCTGKIVVYGLLSAFTFGLTCIPLFRAGPAAKAAIRSFIAEENAKPKYKDKGVEWRLVVHEEVPVSWIEVRKVDPDAVADVSVGEVELEQV